MRKLLLSGLFTLAGLLSFAQPLKEFYPQNAYLVFKQGLSDKADTYYKIPDLKILVNAAGVGEKIEINSRLELVGFAWTQAFSADVFNFISRPEPPRPEPVIVAQPNYQIGKSIQLKIPGYEEISDIYLADESLKYKDATRLNIQLATHSISLGENIGNKRSIVNYKITDETGKIWVEVFQKQPTIEGRLGGSFGNNHPDKQYLPLPEDCNIYLPLTGKYTIQVESRGDLTVDFWVNFPWSNDAQERRLHREDIPPSGVGYYTIDTNQLGLSAMPDYKRTIKINCNGKLN